MMLLPFLHIGMPLHKYLAEALGTFTLALVVWVAVGFTLPIATPLAAGLTLGLFVYTIGGISGAHLNPAVTCALMAVKKISPQEGVMYIISQFVGAVLAMVFGRVATGEVVRVSVTNALTVGIAEAIGAFILVFGISAVVAKAVDKAASGLVVGGSLLLGVLIASAFGNGVLNPAVALAIGSLNLMYIVGPLLGAIAGAFAYRALSE